MYSTLLQKFNKTSTETKNDMESYPTMVLSYTTESDQSMNVCCWSQMYMYVWRELAMLYNNNIHIWIIIITTIIVTKTSRESICIQSSTILNSLKEKAEVVYVYDHKVIDKN